jgi:cystathionine beta-synthase
LAVDAESSILAYTDSKSREDEEKPTRLEGIGNDFIPRNCDRDRVVDSWTKVSDRDAFLMARRIIKEEGILAGGTSGAILFAALKLARNLGSDKRILVIFPDGAKNYTTKFVNDDWMLDNNYISLSEYLECKKTQQVQAPHFNNPISKLNLKPITPIYPYYIVKSVLDEFKMQNTCCVIFF